MKERRMFFATCAPGVERVLHKEVLALGLSNVEQQVGGVKFEADMRGAFRANLWLRTAVRVLHVLRKFQARDTDELYNGVAVVDWSKFMSRNSSLSVHAQCRDSVIRHSQFLSQRVKDAVVDQLRKGEVRPTVDKRDPDFRIHLHLYRDRATLSADTSGESLYKRGWRRYMGRAPLPESLAAFAVILSEWDRRSPLVDPFCGSGTILIEAALLARNLAPGLLGRSFAFEKWPDHDASAFSEEKDKAWTKAVPLPRKLKLVGWDKNRVHLHGASENIDSAGFTDQIQLEQGDATLVEFKKGWNAWIVTNPPFGERMGETETIHDLYRRFGKNVRDRCGGYRLALLCANPTLLEALAVEPETLTEVTHGGLSCAFSQSTIPN